MNPRQVYSKLNKYLWMNRLPPATITFIANDTIPTLHGITLHEEGLFEKPVILLNQNGPWACTLVHEMLHIAEPNLSHGKIFSHLTRIYWNAAKKKYPLLPKLGAQ